MYSAFHIQGYNNIQATDNGYNMIAYNGLNQSYYIKKQSTDKN